MSGDLWYVGVTLSCASNVLSPIGYIVQKRANMRRHSGGASDERRGTAAEPQPGLSSQWLLGCGLVLLSIVLSFLASAFTAQSILAPLSSLALIINMVASALLLGEKVTRLNMVSAVLIVVGSVLSVVFGDHDDSLYTNDGLLSDFRCLEAILYACLSAALCLVIYGVLRLHLLPAAVSVSAGRKQRSVRRGMLNALLYCVLAGAAGAQSDLFGKMVVELVSSTIQGEQQLLSPYPYLYMAAMLAFAALQIHFLSHGLVLSDALYCLPLYECVEILTSTVGAAMLFGELTSSSTKQLLAFGVGLFSLLAGVAVMTLRGSHVRSAGSDSVSSTRSARQSVHNTATMLAQLNVRRWQVTRVREEEEEQEEGRARTVRSKSQSEVELLRSISRVQREKRMVSSVGARAVSLQSTGQLRLSEEVELSVMKLSQLSPTSPAFHRDTSSGRATVTSLSRSISLPTYFFTSLAAGAEPSISHPASPALDMASLAVSPPSYYRTSERWAHVPNLSSSVSLLSPSSRRAAVSRDDVEPLPPEPRERQLSVLAEESVSSNSGGGGESTVAAPTSEPRFYSPPAQPLVRVIRVSRVPPSSAGRHTVSRSVDVQPNSPPRNNIAPTGDKLVDSPYDITFID